MAEEVEGSDLVFHGVDLLDLGELELELIGEGGVVQLVVDDVEGLVVFLLGLVKDFRHDVVLVGEVVRDDGLQVAV